MSDVVIIDDEQVEQVLLKRLVAKVGTEISVTGFSYAEDAISYLRSPERKIPSLIFVDINMPRMDGFQFAESFAGLYPELKGGSQVWVMSNSIDPRDRERAEASKSVSGYVEKTCSDEDFMKIIRDAVLPVTPS